MPKPGVIRERVRKYYAFMSFVLLAFMFAGFRMFYLRGQAFPGRPLIPPIKWLLIVHGVAMTLWVACSWFSRCSSSAGSRFGT